MKREVRVLSGFSKQCRQHEMKEGRDTSIYQKYFYLNKLKIYIFFGDKNISAHLFPVMSFRCQILLLVSDFKVTH